MDRTEFDRDQFNDAYPAGIERSWWHVARNQVIKRHFHRHVPRNAKVVEIGCGPGIVTAHLRAAGWNVTGIDPGTPTADMHLKQHLLLGVDPLALPEEPRMSFDTIALFDVLEHVEDPRLFMRTLLKAFPKVRKAVITVPARRELWSSFDDHYGHLRRYDRPMLRDHLGDAGLRTVTISYFFHSLYPMIRWNNMLRNGTRTVRFNAPAKGPLSVLHWLLGRSIAMDQRLLPPKWHGSSLIIVAERP